MKRRWHTNHGTQRLRVHLPPGPGRPRRWAWWAEAAGVVLIWWATAGTCHAQETTRPGAGRNERPGADSPAAGSGAARAEAPDLGHFRIILDRNIFNASRSGARPAPARTVRRPVRVDTLALVGTLESGSTRVAFFDGSNSDYRKAVRPGEEVAGLTVQEIHFERVYLVRESQRWELPVGGALRREEEADWQMSDAGAGILIARGRNDRTDGAGRGSAEDGPVVTAGSGPTDEVLRKLMERRAREEQ